MNPSLPSSECGLRERKKARTRAAIQREALRLFRERGYAATTVEQIAEAAEISPSTFFRYFPTKEALVFDGDHDQMIIVHFDAQPPELSPLAAFRAAVRSVFAEVGEEELRAAKERRWLAFEEPELRAAALDHLAPRIQMIAQLVARRVGRDPDDFQVGTFAGAVFGVVLAANQAWARRPELGSPLTLIEAALAHLEAGLPL